jgi:hypothetical protein
MPRSIYVDGRTIIDVSVALATTLGVVASFADRLEVIIIVPPAARPWDDVINHGRLRSIS